MRTPAWIFVLACAVLFAAGKGAAQQVPDSTFRPIVERPAFAARPLRVVVDQAHHEFHTADGRYRPFADLLHADGCRVTAGLEPFTAASLGRADLLVIANAAGDDLAAGTDSSASLRAFSPAEIEVVHAWVERGGALLLIADHAPFGAAASVLARRFGVVMSAGYTLDSLQAFDDDGDPSVIEFRRGTGGLGSHSILEGRSADERVNRVVAFTGQSLTGPRGSAPLLKLSRVALNLPPEARALMDDPDAAMRLARPASGRAMGVALRLGRGRVVVLGEAAMLTAQRILREGRPPRLTGMNRPGLDNARFALNVVRWLGGVPLREVPSVAAAAPPPSVASPPVLAHRGSARADFSGHWKLATQETRSWRGRGAIGNHEEPMTIEQTPARLVIRYDSEEAPGPIVYALENPSAPASSADASSLWNASGWDGTTLHTRGRRWFVTPEGPKPFEFREERRLIEGGRRLSVRTRIAMRPFDLERTSEYERVAE